MSLWHRHIVGLICLVALSLMAAQDIQPTKPAVNVFDAGFFDASCGSPFVESQLWYSVDGRVVSVGDGSTVLMTLTKGHRRVAVHLVGIAVEHKGALADEAKGFISSQVLNKSVEVLVNPDWLFQKKKPAEITGVVWLKNSDVGLSLVTKGLARTEEPPPYTMSLYTFCKYREAETKAKSDKLGIWHSQQ